MKCQFLVPFHRLMNALYIALQHISMICCVHFTSVIHNIFWHHNRLFCLLVMPPIIHSFIWMKGGKRSCILSVTQLHGHKWIIDHWLYFTCQKLLRQVAYPFCFCILYPQGLFFSLRRNRDKTSTIKIFLSLAIHYTYKQTDFLQSSWVSKACILWSWNTETHICNSHNSMNIVPKGLIKGSFGLFNSIQFFIIYVLCQQLQGQIQTQHSVKKITSYWTKTT
jgi:hypothetical protein